MDQLSDDKPDQHQADPDATTDPARWIVLGLVLLVVVVYGRVAWFEFVSFDDPLYVYENEHVRHGFSAHGLQWAFTLTDVGHWHPLTWFSLMLDAEIYGVNAGGFHLTNLLYHIVNVLLLLAVLRKMTGALWPSAVVAALFAVHPLHVESVAWVTARKDVLSMTFWLLALLVYTAYAQRGGLGRYLLVALLLSLGLMAKPMLVTLPFVLLLLDFWPLGRLHVGQKLPDSHPAPTRCAATFVLLEKLPLLCLSAASCVITVWSQSHIGAIGKLQVVPISLRLANASVAYVTYLAKMAWPMNLACFYPHPAYLPRDGLPSLNAAAIAAVLLLALVTCLVIVIVRPRPYLAVGWFWYMGTLIPVIGLVQQGPQSMADRFAYLPLLGLYVVIAWGAADLVQLQPRVRLMALWAGIAVLGALTMVAWLQVGFWRNSLVLYNHAICATRHNFLMHNNRGIVLAESGKNDLALHDFSKSIEHFSGYPDAYNNRGLVYRQLKQKELALKDFAKAIELLPRNADAYNNRGLVYRQWGDQELALEAYSRAIKIKPSYAEAYYNRANIHKQLDNHAQALDDYRRAVELKWNFPQAYINRGNLRQALGQHELALDDYSKAIRLYPHFAMAYYNRGDAYYESGKYKRALNDFARAIFLKPDFADAQEYFKRTQARLDESQAGP